MVSSKLFVNKCLHNIKYIVFRNKNLHFDPNSCNISIGNEILERIGNDCVNKCFKFDGLKLDEVLNWDFQIEHISNKKASSIFFALSQIKYILPLNIRLLVYNSLVRPHIEYGIVTWGGVKNSKLQKITSLQKRQSERLIILLSRHIQIHYFQN